MKTASNKTVIIGEFGRPHGVKGHLRVFSYTTPESNILNYSPWLICHDGNECTPLNVLQIKTTPKWYLVQLEGYTSRESAHALTHRLIYTWREQLPELPEGEHYWTDLEGLRVINKQGQKLGTVAYLFATGANDVMVVQSEEQEVLVPYTDSVIVEADFDNNTLFVDWEGE